MANSLKQAEDILTPQELQELISIGQLGPSSRSSEQSDRRMELLSKMIDQGWTLAAESQDAQPGFGLRSQFLKDHGFTKRGKCRFGNTLWEKKGPPYLIIDEDEIQLAKTTNGELIALHPNIAGPTTFESYNEDAADPNHLLRLVDGVGKLVDILIESGYRDFSSLATFIFEEDYSKYERAKPILHKIWNVIARSRGLESVSDSEAEQIYEGIENPS